MTTSPDNSGLVVTMYALSPKLHGGEHLMFWTGIDEAHPGAACWSTNPAAAARFPSIEELEAALSTLSRQHVVAGSPSSCRPAP